MSKTETSIMYPCINIDKLNGGDYVIEITDNNNDYVFITMSKDEMESLINKLNAELQFTGVNK